MRSPAPRCFPIASCARRAASVSRRSAIPGSTQDEWLDGMDRENVKEFGWALAGEEVLTRELEAEDARIKERVAVDPSTALEGST